MGMSDGWEDFPTEKQAIEQIGSFTVKCTDANVSIQDLRGEENRQGTYKVIDTKSFYNEFEIVSKIEALVKQYGNDQELGAAVRKLLGK